MSLALGRPRPLAWRALFLAASLWTGLVAVAHNPAPVDTHRLVCRCAHCPGPAKCCCFVKTTCP